MDGLKNHIPFFQYLSVATAYQRWQLLQSVTTEQVNVICEIALNLLQGNIDLNETDYLSLCKFKNIFRKLVVRSTAAATKRQLIYKHSNAIKELLCAFMNYFSLEGDAESECSSFSESSDDEVSTGSSHCDETDRYDRGKRLQEVDIAPCDTVSAATTSTDERQPVRGDDGTKSTPTFYST